MTRSLPKPPFHFGNTVPPELLIDRTVELTEALNVLTNKKENVLIIGKRRVGKTSLISKLAHELRKRKILLLEVNLLTYDSRPTYFLREVLLLLCYKVGKEIFNKDTVDLLTSLGEKPSSLKTDFGKFYEIYKLARFLSTSKKSASSLDASIQAPAFGGVKSSKTREINSQIEDLQPFEFIQLTDDLMQICRKHSYDSVVVIADEANRLTLETSKEILSAHFDVFSSKNILFVFTADVTIIDYNLLGDIFGVTILLRPFDSIDHLLELLDSYYRQVGENYADEFSQDAISQVWIITHGHPYLIQILCGGSIQSAQQLNHVRVEKEDVMQAWLRLLDKDQKLIELLR